MSIRKRVCVVTGSRAEFGQLLPLLKKMNRDPFFQLDLVVTAAHLSESNTVNEIENGDIPIAERIPIQCFGDNSRRGIANQISEIIVKFSDYFSKCHPDALVIIGDRYEMFGVGIAASTLLIPICHICGGSTTSGAIDEVYRHCLTKMSSLHFTTCDVYRRRVIQLGEYPSVVYNVGSLAIENCINEELLDKNELLNMLGMDCEKPYCVITYHPVTLESGSPKWELMELVHALDSNPQYQYIITLSNADSGGEIINRIWLEVGKKRANFFVVNSLGMRRYLTALKNSEMMIGNSSSGTTEGPAMGIPVINIGDRQKGRIFSEATIHCKPKAAEISAAIKEASAPAFKLIAQKAKNPFGDGTTSEKIVSILKERLSEKIDVKKFFYDISFEVKK